jgi:hypothetical protein
MLLIIPVDEWSVAEKFHRDGVKANVIGLASALASADYQRIR